MSHIIILSAITKLYERSVQFLDSQDKFGFGKIKKIFKKYLYLHSNIGGNIFINVLVFVPISYNYTYYIPTICCVTGDNMKKKNKLVKDREVKTSGQGFEIFK